MAVRMTQQQSTLSCATELARSTNVNSVTGLNAGVLVQKLSKHDQRAGIVFLRAEGCQRVEIHGKIRSAYANAV